MMSGDDQPDPNTSLPENRPPQREEKEISDVVFHYIERLNDGEPIDRDEILRSHPDVGPAVLTELQTYLEIGSNVEPEQEPQLGTLGDYTLRHQIGRGGMGVVYDAWQESLDRHVALKVLPAGIAADNTSFMRFMREAKTAAQLDHPNVVRVHSVGLEKDTPYYAMLTGQSPPRLPLS